MKTVRDLTNEVERLCRKAGVELICPVEINGRLTTTLGRMCFYTDSMKPQKIEFSKKMLACASDYDIEQTIIHETAHYVILMRTGENHGHDWKFKEVVYELGGTEDCAKASSDVEFDYDKERRYEASKKVTRKVENPMIGNRYSVMCPCCGKIGSYKVLRGKITHLEDCRCGKCGGEGLYYVRNF